MEDIKNFRIGKADYLIENNKGSKLKIELDYAKNNFKIYLLERKGNLAKLKKQAGIIARDMLSRKAKKNLNFKLLQLKI